MKHTLVLITAEVLIAAIGGYGLRQGINRANQALERVAAANEATAAATTYALFDHEKPHPKRRGITPAEDAFMLKTPGCAEVAFMGYDNEIHPEYCRP